MELIGSLSSKKGQSSSKVSPLQVTMLEEKDPHDEVHTGEVIGVLFQLLGKVLDIPFTAHVLGDELTDIEQQGAGAAGRVINIDFILSLEVRCDELRHQL